MKGVAGLGCVWKCVLVKGVTVCAKVCASGGVAVCGGVC